jgi:hypothetical protein
VVVAIDAAQIPRGARAAKRSMADGLCMEQV